MSKDKKMCGNGNECKCSKAEQDPQCYCGHPMSRHEVTSIAMDNRGGQYRLQNPLYHKCLHCVCRMYGEDTRLIKIVQN